MDLSNSENKYWSSLAQYNSDPEFIQKSQKEFQSSPLQDEQTEGDGFNRRDFMKLMAASTALASSACFQRPMHKILPYVNQPEEVTFGVANYYASTCGECSTGCGTLVKTREGRPIKIEGNPDHPMSKGGLCARGQASILNLYDPDRLRGPVLVTRGSKVSSAVNWNDADKRISDKLKGIKSGSGRVRVLTGTINSPSTLKLINEFLKGFSHGEHVVYDAISNEQIVQAQEISYGTKVLPRYRFDKADTIVAIDADFLGTWISPVEFTKQFSKNRKVNKDKKKMTKLVAFESVMTITGSNADLRVPIRPTDGAAVALAIAYELVVNMRVGGSDAAETLKSFRPSGVAHEVGFDENIIKRVAKDLWETRGRSLVVAGSPQSQTESGLALQVAVNFLNSLLQNDGVTVDGTTSPSLQGMGSYVSLNKLLKDMNDGQVDALFIYRSNPVYTLPKDLGFEKATKKVGLVLSFNDHADETTVVSDYILPDTHPLESWGDAEPQKNLFSLIQPTIRPIYDTRSFQDSLLSLNRGGLGIGRLSQFKDFHEFVQNNWRETVYKEFASAVPFVAFWETALRDGVFDGVSKHGGRNSISKGRSFKSQSLKEHLPLVASSGAEEYSLALYAKVSMYDGRSANNPWLQELPDPISRITWDNYVSLAPKTAEKLNIKDGDIVALNLNGVQAEFPAHIQPGMHERSLALALGYGRVSAGSVGNDIGQNAFAHVKYKGSSIMSGLVTTLSKTGKKYSLASVQENHTMHGRPIVKETTLEEYEKNQSAGNEEKEELTTIWSGHEYKGYRWAMAIDLNSCTGCAACVVGCTSENNVPVVGKDAVLRGRIMHWIRIDRYYSGTPDNPSVVHQPMLCQHCENAPCETVCPVIATVHDAEGINQQIYNRCVGTRYCANNCPYKVRRFNWFDYNYGGQTRYPQTLSQNPEVTIRSRGVMEKCTFCIQRVTDGKNKAKDMGRSVQDGDIKTACQQSCPADAIVFGNINDSESAVTGHAKDPRGYHVLEELNVRPSITYLTKVRNTEPI